STSVLVSRPCARCLFFLSSRRRHTRLVSDWSSDVCSSDLSQAVLSTKPACRRVSIPAPIGSAWYRRRALGIARYVTQRVCRCTRSEERRVGKEGRRRGSPDH